eukprot:TRINITY_DN7137_c0_g1_i2.p1 TRINITY_DN7137_c0_g1~~TRINITY_DN7137_c0_g1_i2.p1  ORF type:complete len:186 (-),score=39.43 TRINITY_DN7137_c0_g1_i2:26-583(-)
MCIRDSKYGVREGDCVYLSLPPNKVAKPVTPPPLALPNTNNFGDISLNVDGGSMNPHSQSANSNNLNNSTLGDSTISPGGGGGGPNTSAITTRNRSRSLSSTNKSPASRVRGQSMGARQAPPPGLSIGLSLIHISEPTRLLSISYAVFCLKKKKKKKINKHHLKTLKTKYIMIYVYMDYNIKYIE